jgi:hypothetical protein
MEASPIHPHGHLEVGFAIVGHLFDGIFWVGYGDEGFPRALGTRNG